MHFASAAALLLRLVGIPTRYVAGYVADIPASGKANVPDSNAHAWVEVYLDGYGWEPVEVTPAYAGSRPGQSGTVAQPSPTPGAAITPRPSAGPATPWPTPTPTPAPSPADESSSMKIKRGTGSYNKYIACLFLFKNKFPLPVIHFMPSNNSFGDVYKRQCI